MPSAKQIVKRHKRKELTSKVLTGLLTVGACAVACSSPRFARHAFKILLQCGLSEPTSPKEHKRYTDMFTYLRRRGLIDIEFNKNQLHISLTAEGKKRAKQYQINDLEILKPTIWDGLWRILIFDIPESTRVKREALRGKLKDLGFSYLQRSVWVHPYPCQDELDLLKSFFGFTPFDYLYFETHDLGPRTLSLLRRYKLRSVAH